MRKLLTALWLLAGLSVAQAEYFTITPLASGGGGGSGTVTTVSVATANGLAGTVATATTTPVITLTTSINSPLLAGNGTAISAATTTGSGSTAVLNNGPTLIAPVLGTPASGVATNLTGTASGLTAGTVTTNANLTGDVTSVGNATTLVTAQPGAHTWALGQTFSSAMTYGGVTLSNAVTGTGNMVLSAAPTFTTSITHGVGPAILTSNAAASTMLGAATSATAAVAQTLTVSGSSGNSAAAALFTIAGSDQTGTGTTGGELRLRAGNGVTVGGIISFYTSATTTPARAMVINTNGYVGIGIAAPTSAALTVRNDTVDPVQWGSSSTNVGVLSYSGAAGAETSVSMGAITNIPLNLRVNNATRLYISATAGLIVHGAADAASPVNQILTSQGSRVGTDSNVAGSNFTFKPGVGTGNATPSALNFNSWVAVASGSATQTDTLTMQITAGIVSIPVATDATTSTGGVLQVAGGASIAKRFWIPAITASSGLQTAVLCQSSGGEMIADSVACLASGSQFKTILGPMEDGALSRLMTLPIERWRYNAEGNFRDANWTRERIGPIAQDVAMLDTRLIGYDKDGGIRTYSTDQLLAFTIKAVQELNAKVDRMQIKPASAN